MAVSNGVHHYSQTRAKPARQRKTPEADLQAACVEYLNFALDPKQYRFRCGMEGARRSKYEGAKAKRLGFRKGWLDIEIKNRQTGAVRWAEIKSATGSLTPEQREFIEECPEVCAVVRSLADMEAALLGWGLTPRVGLDKANRYG